MIGIHDRGCDHVRIDHSSRGRFLRVSRCDQHGIVHKVFNESIGPRKNEIPKLDRADNSAVLSGDRHKGGGLCLLCTKLH